MDTSQIPLPGIVTHLTRPPPRRHRPGPSEHRSRNHYRIPFRHCIPSSSFSLTGAAACRPKLGSSGPKARSLGMPTHARSRLSRAPYWTAAAAAAPPPRLAKTTTAFASFRSYRFQPNDVIAPELPLCSPKLWVSLSIRAGRQAGRGKPEHSSGLSRRWLSRTMHHHIKKQQQQWQQAGQGRAGCRRTTGSSTLVTLSIGAPTFAPFYIRHKTWWVGLTLGAHDHQKQTSQHYQR